MPINKLLCLYVLCTLLINSVLCDYKPLRIGIVGGGISGSSVAYWISSQLNNTDVVYNITLYEKSNIVGGRIQSVTINNHTIESGASIIHSSNQYIYNFTSQFNLSFSEPPSAGSSTTGIWDGATFVFTTSTSLVWTALKLVWRYGLAYTTLYDCIESIAKSFWNLYDIQLNNMTYTTVDELLQSVNLYNVTQINMTQYLYEHSLYDNSLIVQELVTSAIRVNYGQNLSVNALAGSVGVIPLTNPSCFQIDGGNVKLVESLLEATPNINIKLNTHVTEINKLQSTGTYELVSRYDGVISIHEYDYIVLATPLELADIQFKGDYTIDITNLPKRIYHTTHTTFISGVINSTYFGMKNYNDLPSSIVTIENDAVEFTSLTQCTEPDTNHHCIYKIFSRHILSDITIDKLFVSYDKSTIHHIPWMAYPKFSPPEQYAPFRLDDKLYYSNAWENSVSCMECELIGSKNIALLVLQSLGFSDSNINTPHIDIDFDNDEL